MKIAVARGVLGVLIVGFAFALAASAAYGKNPGIVGNVSPASIAGEVEVCVIEARPSERCVHPDEGGAYVLTPLNAGAYRVVFLPSYQSHYVAQYYNHAARLSEANTVTVGVLGPKEGINADLELGGEIEGTVTDSLASAALEDVEVCAIDTATELPAGCTHSGTAGNYAIPSVPPGTYRVGFWGEKSSAAYAPQFYADETSIFEATPVPVTAGASINGIDAQLHLGASFEGTVTAAAGGARLAGIAVCAFQLGAAKPERCAITDGNGGYAMPGVPSGSYEVVFSPEFNEFATGEFVLPEEDGYRTQYYSAASSRAQAKTLSLIAPALTAGVDASLLSTQEESLPSAPPQLQPTVTPTVASPPSAPKKPKSKKCKHGFKKRKVKGKVRCVKVHRHKKQRRRH
jgi:hypothetical protein